MEKNLRALIKKNPTEEFRGLFIEGSLSATRKNVLVPGSIGVYTGGSNYNPSQILRNSSVDGPTAQIDALLAGIANRSSKAMSLVEIMKLVRLTVPDPEESELLWNTIAIVGAIEKYAAMSQQKVGTVYVDRERGLDAKRRETQGIIEGSEVKSVPNDQIALFILRTKKHGNSMSAWWPQVRFPDGPYGFAFAL